MLHQSGALVKDVAAIIAREQPDLFLMQEVTSEIDPLKSIGGGNYYRQDWPTKRHGLAVWSASDLSPTSPLVLPSSKLPGSFPRRMAQLIKYDDVTIVNVHLSHGQALNRLQLRKIARATNGPTAIIGDYNALGKVTLEGFCDVGPKGATHRAQRIMPFRLDRCMIRNMECLGACKFNRGVSDHQPIYIELAVRRDEQVDVAAPRDSHRNHKTERGFFWHC